MEAFDVHFTKINGEGSVASGSILSRDPLGKLGGTEEKYRDIISVNQRPVEFIERHPSRVSVPENGKENPLEFTVERIKILHENDIPTPVFYKASISDSDPVLLAENVMPIGGAIYGKSAVERILRGEVRDMDQTFVRLIDQKARDIFGKDESDPPVGSLWSWFIHANTKGVVLPSDDAMELIVSPNGEFKWMVLDPAGVATSKELGINQMDLVAKNLESVKQTFEDVYLTLYKTLKANLQG